MIPYSKQNINNADIKKIQKVLKSNFLTTGPEVEKFENKLGRFVNSKYAVAVSSASAAIHIACLALGIKKDDYVWTTPITFASTASGPLHCGARIDLVDIDKDTFNLSIDALKKKLLIAKKQKKLPKLIIPVHLAGNPCDMKSLKFLSKKYKFKIIEDASHALGSEINKQKIGNSKYSDITVFSFHPVKIITTGEGGMVLTKNKDLYQKIKSLREHGIVRNKKNFLKKNDHPWYYEQQSIGFNYRMTDIQAALGISQLDRVRSFVKERNKIAKFYNNKFKLVDIISQKLTKNSYSSYHLYIVLFAKNIRLKIFNELRKNKFFVNLHYIPLFLHPVHSKKFDKKLFPNSMDYYQRAISIPIYPGLKKNHLNRLVKIIKHLN
jgi:UDP-4-amino-4,6-dideoxy-N-acetyl-beta-L-altrosamine transaminase